MKKQIQLLGGLMAFIALLTINSTAFADFVIKGGGTVVVMNGTSLTANTNVTIESSGTLDNNGTVTLNANFTNNGIADLGTGSIVLSGAAMQEFGGSSVSEIDHLTVNNTGPGVTLSGSLRVDNSFTLTDGLVDMADYSLTLGPTISEVLGTPSVNNMIVTNGLGELRKEFEEVLGTFVYPLGDNLGDAEWSPLALDVIAGEFFAGDYIGASVKNEKHPNNNSYDHYLNRYWSITTNGTISALIVDATGTYVEADVVGTETSIREGLFVSPEWFVYDPIDDAGNTITFDALSDGGDITGVEFQYLAGLKVFLQGAYEPATDNMHVLMRDVIPLTASEAYLNRGYSGTESVTDRADIPITAVDWVLVELRDATEASSATSGTAIQTVAGFVLSDGSIVSVDGESALPFKSTLTNNPYFVIIHRNHLSAMSAQNELTKTNSTYIYDFSVASQIYGTEAVVELEANTGIYGLFAGETNTSNIISNADKQAVDDNIDELYHIGDVNLSGIVSNEDKQFVDENIDSWGKVPK